MFVAGKNATLAVLLGLCIAAPGWAQVYQCKDASGKTSYTDTPCDPQHLQQQQQGRLLQGQKSPEQIEQERNRSNEALDRKYRDRQDSREQQRLDLQQQEQSRAATQAPVNLADSPRCRSAQKELEFVSSIRTLGEDERRMRLNAEIARVNAACGSNTPLMQEPPKVIVHPGHSKPGS
ncbi:DUF4124 domain-containing protein [Diaphorobacter aerolatus]|uniref:DUF4124 domain-containing protein n=2 Tax=Diaphorobacter aerolatus TaxID=1288495 RepID=A0A7H0GQL3_9BURK|nr:DUF4124 domain-containing protein [Diaphorobacter aerolatus]